MYKGAGIAIPTDGDAGPGVWVGQHVPACRLADKKKRLADPSGEQDLQGGMCWCYAWVRRPDASSQECLALPLSCVLRCAAGPLDPSTSISCEVCMCDHPGSECGRNGCGHTFCNTCWQSHLAVQIKEGKARHISCMAFKCGVVCDEELVLKVIQVRVSGGACGSVGRSLVNKAGGGGGPSACRFACPAQAQSTGCLVLAGTHACIRVTVAALLCWCRPAG